MINKFEKYGKEGMIGKTIRNLRERLSISDHQRNFQSYGVKLYIPKLNKFRMVVGSIGLIGCLSTPGTNWLGMFIVPWMLI